MGDVRELKNEIDKICKGLADKGEESIFVTVSLEKTTCFVMGSDIGLQWLDSQSVMVQKFFKFCADQYQVKEIKKENEDPNYEDSYTMENVVDTEVENSTDFLQDVRFRNQNDTSSYSLQMEREEINNRNSPTKTNQAQSSNQALGMTLPTLPLVSTKTKTPTKTVTHTISPNMAAQKSTNQRNFDPKTIENSPNRISNLVDNTAYHSATKDRASLMAGTTEISTPVVSPKKLQAENRARKTPKKRKNQSLDRETLVEAKKYKTDIASPVSYSPSNTISQELTAQKSTDQQNLHPKTIENCPTSVLNGEQESLGDSSLNISNSVPNTNGGILDDFTNVRRRSRKKQTNEDVHNENLSIGIRPKRTPVPRKLHHMECFVKLTDIKSSDREQLIHDTVTDDPTLNRSEVNDELVIYDTAHHNNSMSSQVEPGEIMTNLSNEMVDIVDNDDGQNINEDEDNESFIPFEVGCSDEDEEDDDYNVDKEEEENDYDADSDFDEKPKPKENSNKVKFSRDMLIKNYANNLKSVNKRNKKRGGGKFKCESCGLMFKTLQGYKQHRITCGIVKCPQCHQSFESMEELLEHAKSHEGEDLHKCGFCEKTFKMITNLKKHETMEHRKKNFQYKCPHCPKKFFTGSFVRVHLKDVHKDFRNICLACNKFFDTKFNYNVHMNDHRQTKIQAFMCKKCGRSFELLYYLKRHNRWFHKAKGERICKFCLDYFPNEAAHKEHLKEHEWDKPNTCTFCRESFHTKDILDEHVRNVHNKGIMYICEICGFEADHNLSLKYHKMEHEEKMPFICGQCGKGFPLKTKLKEHMINHISDLPFVCETCGKRFKRRTTLRSHMIVHSEGKTCKFCSRNFRSVGGLDYHIVRCHADQVNTDNYKKRLHKCEECNKFFPSKNSYQHHLVKHSSVRTWGCESCDKMFKTEQQKNRHEANHLREKPFYCDVCFRSFTSKPRWEAHAKTDKHKSNSGKSRDVLDMEREKKKKGLEVKKKELEVRQSRLEALIHGADTDSQSMEVTEDNFDQSASATMIDLPETTILVIGDYHGLDLVSDEVTDLVSDEVTGEAVPVQYIQTDLQAE